MCFYCENVIKHMIYYDYYYNYCIFVIDYDYAIRLLKVWSWPDVMVSVAIKYATHTSLDQIYSNLKTDQYISDILRPVVVLYFSGLPNAFFLQDNSRLLVAHCVLTFLIT